MHSFNMQPRRKPRTGILLQNVQRGLSSRGMNCLDPLLFCFVLRSTIFNPGLSSCDGLECPVPSTWQPVLLAEDQREVEGDDSDAGGQWICPSFQSEFKGAIQGAEITLRVGFSTMDSYCKLPNKIQSRFNVPHDIRFTSLY